MTDLEILTEQMPVAVRKRSVGFVKCADCGQVVDLYFDGEEIRVAVHDVCGMGGQPLEVQVRARRVVLELESGSEAQP